MQLFGTLAIFCITPFVISTTYMGIYWTLHAEAGKVNEEYKTETIENPFDNCDIVKSDGGLGNTKWTVVFSLNAIVQTLLTTASVLLTLSAFVHQFAICGACLVCCTQCAHFASIIVTGVYRYSIDGKKCAEKDAKLDVIDKSYKDIGATMNNVFISQCVLYCFFACCLGCLTQVAYAVALHRRQTK